MNATEYRAAVNVWLVKLGMPTDELDYAQPLRDLAHRELVLVRVPEPAAASVLRMVADAMRLEPNVTIAHCVLQRNVDTLGDH